MLRRKKYVFCLLMAMCFFLTSCCVNSGIKIKGTDVVFFAGNSKESVMSAGDFSLNADQILLLYTALKKGYSDILTTKIWDVDIDGVKFSDALVESVKEMAARLLVVNMLAKDNGIELSNDEIMVCEDNSRKYVDSLGADTGISYEEAKSLFMMLALSDKTYYELTKNVNTNVSVDEARIIRIMYIYSKDSYNTIYDAFKQLEEGSEFAVVAGKYSDSSEYIAEIGRGEMVSEFEEAAFSLDTGMISNIINCDIGYYIIKCIDDNVVDKALGQRQLIIEHRCQKQFNEFFDNYAPNVSIDFNENIWNSIMSE